MGIQYRSVYLNEYMYIQICLLKQPNAVPGDAISSKNVARQIADFPFGIILNNVFISDYMSDC